MRALAAVSSTQEEGPPAPAAKKEPGLGWRARVEAQKKKEAKKLRRKKIKFRIKQLKLKQMKQQLELQLEQQLEQHEAAESLWQDTVSFICEKQSTICSRILDAGTTL